jgi:hypothetical protein
MGIIFISNTYPIIIGDFGWGSGMGIIGIYQYHGFASSFSLAHREAYYPHFALTLQSIIFFAVLPE